MVDMYKYFCKMQGDVILVFIMRIDKSDGFIIG